MTTQPYHDFDHPPLDTNPPRPIPSVTPDTLPGFIQRVGVFHVAPNGSHLATSVYSEPASGQGFPEGRIYWMESAVLSLEEAPDPRWSADFTYLGDVLTQMNTIAPPEQWQVFMGEPRSVQ